MKYKDSEEKKWHDHNMNQMCDNLEKSSKVPFVTTPTPERSVEEKWQTKFLNAGTEKGLGDLSMMIGVVSEILQSERQKREEVVGWKGYVVVDPETDYYTYSNVFFKKSEAEKKLKDFDVNGLKVIEVDVTLTQPNNPK